MSLPRGGSSGLDSGEGGRGTVGGNGRDSTKGGGNVEERAGGSGPASTTVMMSLSGLCPPEIAPPRSPSVW